MPTDPELPPDPLRWATILGLLSLDLAGPLIPAMGLQLPPGPAFRDRLRESIVEFRGLQATDEEEAARFSPTFLDRVAADFGPPFASHLRRWGEEVFQYSGSDGVGVFLWDNVVRRGGLDGSRDKKPPPEAIRVLRLRLASQTLPPGDPPPPSTDWDRQYYHRHVYGETFEPMDRVENTISYCNFVRAWGETVAAPGSKADLKAIRAWGEEVAGRLGMPLDRLGQPGDWPSLPPAWREGG